MTTALLLALTFVAGPDAPRFLHEDSVQAVAFSSDGKSIASAGVDRSIRLWTTSTGELIRTVGEHEGRILALSFSPDGELLASASSDTKVHLWDASRGKIVRTLSGHKDTIQALAFSPDGKFLATASLDQTVRLWDVATGKVFRVLDYPDDRAPALAFSTDGTEVYVGFNPGPKVRRYSVTTGKISQEWQVHRNGDLTSVVVAGRFCIAGTASGILWRFDSQGVLPPERIPLARSEGCLSLGASPDGKLLLVGGAWGWLELIEIATSRSVRSFSYRTTGVHLLDQQPRMEVNPRIRTVCFSPTTAYLAAGNQEGHLRIWRLIDLIPPKVLTTPQLTAEEVQASWDALEGDAQTAYRELARLATYPRQTLPFLAERLKPVPGVNEKQVRLWIEQLDDDDFDTREKAHQQLLAVGKSVEGILRDVHRSGKLPREAARRVAELLEPLSQTSPDGSAVRDQRVVLLLQVLGSPEARKLLEVLATGSGASPATRDAQSALRRLSQR